VKEGLALLPLPHQRTIVHKLPGPGSLKEVLLFLHFILVIDILEIFHRPKSLGGLQMGTKT